MEAFVGINRVFFVTQNICGVWMITVEAYCSDMMPRPCYLNALYLILIDANNFYLQLLAALNTHVTHVTYDEYAKIKFSLHVCTFYVAQRFSI